MTTPLAGKKEKFPLSSGGRLSSFVRPQ